MIQQRGYILIKMLCAKLTLYHDEIIMNTAENERCVMQNTSGVEVTLEEYNPALAEHKAAFGALNREWLERYFYVEPQDEAMFADPQGVVIAKGGAIIFARANGQIIGTCGLKPMEEGVYEIVRMAVTQQWQKHKIGEKLLLAILAKAKEKNAKKLFIISSTILEGAIRLYRRYGFTDSPEPRHKAYARGDITLELPLT